MAAASERVFEFLDEEEEDQTVKNPVSTEGIKEMCIRDRYMSGNHDDS